VAGVSHDCQPMLLLLLLLVQAMPGTPPLAPVAAEASLGLKLGRTAAALSVLLLGAALVLAPSAVLGNLLSTTAESVTGGALDRRSYDTWWAAGGGLTHDVGCELAGRLLPCGPCVWHPQGHGDS
jgi:hypothetical protein